MKRSKLLLASVSTAVLLGAFASAASAGRLSYSEERITASWSGIKFRGGGVTIACEVTLNSTLHSRSITKTNGLLIGYVTAGSVNRCSGGHATLLRETLPWHTTYESFSGTLPNISAIRSSILGAAFRISEQITGFECLLRASAEQPLFAIYNRSTASGQLVSASVGGSIRCSIFNYAAEGLANVTDGATARVTLTLI